MAAAVTRRRIGPSVSDKTDVRCKLGKNRRLVLILEWLTLCPTCTPLPVMMHFLAMTHLDPAQPRNDPRGRWPAARGCLLGVPVALRQARAEAGKSAAAPTKSFVVDRAHARAAALLLLFGNPVGEALADE